jgi:hypothetical protein
MRLVALSILLQGIDLRCLISSPCSPIPRTGHHTPAMIAAASAVPRLVQPLHHDPGERAHLADLSLFSIRLYFVMPAFTVTLLAEVCRR